MSLTPPPFSTYRVITAEERRECAGLADLNEDAALQCPPDRGALKKLLLINAELLRRIADAPAQKTP